MLTLLPLSDLTAPPTVANRTQAVTPGACGDRLRYLLHHMTSRFAIKPQTFPKTLGWEETLSPLKECQYVTGACGTIQFVTLPNNILYDTSQNGHSVVVARSTATGTGLCQVLRQGPLHVPFQDGGLGEVSIGHQFIQGPCLFGKQISLLNKDSLFFVLVNLANY